MVHQHPAPARKWAADSRRPNHAVGVMIGRMRVPARQGPRFLREEAQSAGALTDQNTKPGTRSNPGSTGPEALNSFQPLTASPTLV